MDPIYVLAPLTVGATLGSLPLGARDALEERVSGGARVVGRILFLVVAYSLSFGKIARSAWIAAPGSPTLLLAVVPLAAIAALLLFIGLKREKVDPLARGEAMLMVAALPAVYAGLALEGGRGAVIVANLAIAYLGLGRIMRGRSSRSGAALREGIAIVVVLLACRALELAGVV